MPEVELGRVLRLGGADHQAGVAANGYVVARKRAALSTDIQGRLVEIPVEEGDRVKEGDLIARIDTTQLEAARDRARANIQKAQATARLAELERDRIAELHEQGNASASERDAAVAEWEGATAEIKALEADLKEIEVMIGKSSVFAPFDGIVVEKNAEVGGT